MLQSPPPSKNPVDVQEVAVYGCMTTITITRSLGPPLAVNPHVVMHSCPSGHRAQSCPLAGEARVGCTSLNVRREFVSLTFEESKQFKKSTFCQYEIPHVP